MWTVRLRIASCRQVPNRRHGSRHFAARRPSETRRRQSCTSCCLRAARFELGRRQAALSHVRGEELDDIAMQAANDALMAVLAKLDDFRGASRFTTWAYKFALLEAGVKLRRRAWQDREVVLEPRAGPASPTAASRRTRSSSRRR